MSCFVLCMHSPSTSKQLLFVDGQAPWLISLFSQNFDSSQCEKDSRSGCRAGQGTSVSSDRKSEGKKKSDQETIEGRAGPNETKPSVGEKGRTKTGGTSDTQLGSVKSNRLKDSSVVYTIDLPRSGTLSGVCCCCVGEGEEGCRLDSGRLRDCCPLVDFLVLCRNAGQIFLEGGGFRRADLSKSEGRKTTPQARNRRRNPT